MIKGSSKKGEVQLEINGGVGELCADLICLSKAMYKAIKEESVEAASEFKVLYNNNLSTIFDIEEEEKSHKSEIEELLRNTVKALKDWIENED